MSSKISSAVVRSRNASPPTFVRRRSTSRSPSPPPSVPAPLCALCGLVLVPPHRAFEFSSPSEQQRLRTAVGFDRLVFVVVPEEEVVPLVSAPSSLSSCSVEPSVTSHVVSWLQRTLTSLLLNHPPNKKDASLSTPALVWHILTPRSDATGLCHTVYRSDSHVREKEKEKNETAGPEDKTEDDDELMIQDITMTDTDRNNDHEDRDESSQSDETNDEDEKQNDSSSPPCNTSCLLSPTTAATCSSPDCSSSFCAASYCSPPSHPLLLKSSSPALRPVSLLRRLVFNRQPGAVQSQARLLHVVHHTNNHNDDAVCHCLKPYLPRAAPTSESEIISSLSLSLPPSLSSATFTVTLNSGISLPSPSSGSVVASVLSLSTISSSSPVAAFSSVAVGGPSYSAPSLSSPVALSAVIDYSHLSFRYHQCMVAALCLSDRLLFSSLIFSPPPSPSPSSSAHPSSRLPVTNQSSSCAISLASPSAKETRPMPFSVLLLGLGGGSLLMYLHQCFIHHNKQPTNLNQKHRRLPMHVPTLTFDAVEVQSKVVRIAHQYFGVPEPISPQQQQQQSQSPQTTMVDIEDVHERCSTPSNSSTDNIRIHVADGLDFVTDFSASSMASSTTGVSSYDAVFIDVNNYTSSRDSVPNIHGLNYPPAAFVTVEYLTAVRRIMAPGGVLVLNLGTRSCAAYDWVVANLLLVFGAANNDEGSGAGDTTNSSARVYQIPCHVDENRVIVAVTASLPTPLRAGVPAMPCSLVPFASSCPPSPSTVSASSASSLYDRLQISTRITRLQSFMSAPASVPFASVLKYITQCTAATAPPPPSAAVSAPVLPSPSVSVCTSVHSASPAATTSLTPSLPSGTSSSKTPVPATITSTAFPRRSSGSAPTPSPSPSVTIAGGAGSPFMIKEVRLSELYTSSCGTKRGHCYVRKCDRAAALQEHFAVVPLPTVPDATTRQRLRLHPDPKMNYISWEEIKKHNKPNDCWLVAKNIVYDVTPFLPYHPAGHKSVLRNGGLDATVHFEFHSGSAQKLWRQFEIGRVEGTKQDRQCVIM